MTVWEYVKSRKYIILLFLACSAIHVTVLLAYKYNSEPVLYAAFLYLVLLVTVGVFDYGRKRKKCKLLKAYDVCADGNLQELLTGTDPIMVEYGNIIFRQKKLLMENTNACLQREKESQDFYTMWVHQIKTPIAALQVLLQTSPENVSGMKGELFKIERYVDIVLNYLRMEDINGDLLLRHYSLDSMVKQAVKKYTPLFIQSKLSLKLEDLERFVLTDEKWLVFVLEQLLSNAIKYTKKGEIRISATSMFEADRKITRLTIEDSGMGIRPEDLPRIFERAFTGYNGRNDKKASGLGLYLCKTILNRLGHEITITSKPGEGTVVVLTFYEDNSFCGNLTKV